MSEKIILIGVCGDSVLSSALTHVLKLQADREALSVNQAPVELKQDLGKPEPFVIQAHHLPFNDEIFIKQQRKQTYTKGNHLPFKNKRRK